MRSYMTWGSMAHTVYQIANSSKYIAHDFFYVTTKQAFVFFASRGFNVVWQNNEFMLTMVLYLFGLSSKKLIILM